jgi:lysophospholipase L1-like esterase
VPRPAGLVQKKSSSIRELASRPGVVLLDEHTFDSLEHPELFKDAFHLNDDGCARFSAILAREVSKALGPVALLRPRE